ncbi:cysteine desulfuration protein [Volvox carteri f. nagariensis]|uniref:Cysteine desulfuration protein n=1 Tax=Volvox carteri f. nagariensis TaxID=3068 RepID=D8TYS2_VOLCA|nr:cysteine desulfuration protein [Volvox carteri f. nagariensis]EFJ47442.1 cysteine desulfuration protein [Volvox carteri f. nagariensis]|eukprot:XP_002951631.1 cysteine desulfuration protein [Volvox carteri f. nagariensis]
MIAHRHARLAAAPHAGLKALRRGFTTQMSISQAIRSQASRAVSTCRAQKTSEFPPSLQKIVGAFQMVPDPMARYKQLLFFATKLAPMPAEDHIPENKVEGCVSQVWVVPELRSDGKIYWRADSDSQLTKASPYRAKRSGLAALLVTGLSGCTPAEILSVQPTFIEMLGLKQSLTPSRNNGFLNMFRLMQRKTLELVAAAARADGGGAAAGGTAAEPAAQGTSSGNGNGATAATPAATTAASGSSSSSSSATTTSSTPVEDGMRRKLLASLSPSVLNIWNDSAQHAGHAGAMAARHGKAGETGETHFRVEVVSEAFEGMTQVKRQRMIYQLLEEEFAMGLHALSLVTRTPVEAAAAATTRT